MFYCSTVLLFYFSIFSTVLHGYCSTVLLIYCSTFLLFYCSTVLLFYFPTFLLAHHKRNVGCSWYSFSQTFTTTTLTDYNRVFTESTTPTHTIVAEKNLFRYVCLLSSMGKVSLLLLGLESSNWGRIQFLINWCTLHVWWSHQGRTLTVERSPISAMVTKM